MPLGRLCRHVCLIFYLLLAVPLWAQAGFDGTGLGQAAALDHGWRVGILPDSVDASAADYDDSAWAVRDVSKNFDEVNEDADKHAQGDVEQAARSYVWLRLHVKLPPRPMPLALLVELPVERSSSLNIGSAAVGEMEVFANGQPVVPDGPHGRSVESYERISRVYTLPVARDQMVIAIRIPYIALGLGSYTEFFAHHTLLLGARESLESRVELWLHHVLFERLPRLVSSSLYLVLACFLLVLYLTERDHREYLWLGLHYLALGPCSFLELAGSLARMEHIWSLALWLQLTLIAMYFYVEFLAAFLALRRRWYVRLLRWSSPVLLVVMPLLFLIDHGHGRLSGGWALALLFVGLLSVLWVGAYLLFVLLSLSVAALKRNWEAAALLVPFLFSLVGTIEPLTTEISREVSGSSVRSPLTFFVGPIPVHFDAVADFTGILAIVLIVFVRFLRIQQERQQAASELAAARGVQELMIPHESVPTPGFVIDSVYKPANEVGGDFFHMEPTADGGLVVVLGDVAGKGLRAAMHVAMLVGALRSEKLIDPVKILAMLNRVLQDGGSMTTCLAAYFAPSGEVTLATAGHLPPYLNSREVAVPAGLPLGVLRSVDYEATRVYLHPGDRLLMLSDGVVEAKKSDGELFGFARVENLSNQSAFYLADAACDWGQEDDITVLAVRRAAS